MTPVIAYYKYNIKVLLQDKLPLIWSIVVPSIFLFFNKNSIQTELDLRFWWAYIIITSYLYGIGLYSMTMKESGTLKTLFSICYQPFSFFYGNLLTQITYCIFCLSLFDIGAILYLKLSWLTVLSYSLIYIIILIPVAFFSMLFTLFKKIHVNSLSSLTNIILMVFFFSMNIDGPISKINIILYFANIIMLESPKEFILYLIICGLMILCGLVSIIHFSVIPIERR